MSQEIERRSKGVTRIPFDAVVEVGGAVGPSFEAKALNLSSGGILLRTAYLPEVGERLSCSFVAGEGGGVLATGEVMWIQQKAKGGDFAIRFTDLDRESERALQNMTFGAGERVPTKVRLHIDGLANPMRMNIVDEESAKLRVSSDLGFLQVGKELQLEDGGFKRPAQIDRVEMELDPNSRVPHLVVSLKYTDIEAPAVEKESTPEPTVSDNEGHDEEGASFRDHEDHGDASDEEEASMDDHDGDEVDVDVHASGADPIDDETHDEIENMKSPLAKKLQSVAPMMKLWGERAKTTFKVLAERNLKKSQETEKHRRVTAPAPSGGLHANGRRVVRTPSQPEIEEKATMASWKPSKKTITIGAAGASVLLLGALLVRKPAEPPQEVKKEVAAVDTTTTMGTQPGTTTLTGATVPATSPVGAVSPGVVGAQGAIAPAAQGNPAYGPSTPNYGPTYGTPGTASGTYGNTGIYGPSSTSVGMDDSNSPATVSDALPSVSSSDAPVIAKHANVKVTPFGDRGLNRGVTLRLKMDAPITSIQGANQASGFVVAIPGRKSLEPAAPLAARDARISSMRIMNQGSGAELTVQFRDGVPNYVVRAKGDTLEIVIANPKAPLSAPAKNTTTKTKTRKGKRR